MDPEQIRLKLQREFSGEKSMGSKEKSMQLKEQGNIYYKQKRYQDALECYDKAIVSAL